MSAQAMIVDSNKDLVDLLLSYNTANRNIKKTVVQKYMREIKEGRWVLTNQGIGVSESGVLIDGQHRLEAIKQCGYPEVPLLVLTGLPDSAKFAVDQHAKRTSRDMIQFAFDSRVNRLAPAIATSYLTCGDRKRGPHSMHDIYDWIVEHHDLLEEVLAIPTNIGFFAAPHLAGFIFCIVKESATIEHLKKFIEGVETGQMLTKEDPQLHLRNFIMASRKSSAGEMMRIERFIKSAKAFLAYARGQKMLVLRA